MPWPRIFSLPKRAINPMMSEPATGTSTAHRPSGESLQIHFGEAEAAEIGDVGGELDQLEKPNAGRDARGRDNHGDCRDHKNAWVGGEITKIGLDGMRFGGKDAHG